MPFRWDFSFSQELSASLALATRTGRQCREFHAALPHTGSVDYRNLRFWEFSNVYAKGTSERVVARLLPALMVLASVLLLAAGLQVGDARAAIDVAAKVRVEIVARPGSAFGAAQDFMVREGAVLRSGDGLQLRLESDTDAYVYIVAYGSSNTAMLLQPFSARPDDALIRQGGKEVIPEAGIFLPLDDQEGRETLFIIISDVPLTNILDLLPRIESHGDNLAAITAMVNATYPTARRLSFKHIGARALVGVAASAPRVSPSGETPGSTAEKQDTDGDPSRVDGASLLPPASEAASVPVSLALRKAREAAGIDKHQFRGILATLPNSGRADVPESIRKPYEEQGVLSAGGNRIRALGRAQLQSGASWPSNDGGSREKIQN